MPFKIAPARTAARFLAAALLGLALLAWTPLRAATYYVEAAHGDSDDPQLLKALSGLIEDAVSQSGNTAADRLGPDTYDLKPELYRFGRSLLVVLKLWSPGPDPRTLLLSVRRKVSREDGLEEAAERLTRSVIADRSPGRWEEGSPEEDGDTPLRFSFNLGMGPHLLEDLEVPSGAAAQTYGLDLGLEWPVAERFTLTLGNDYAWCDTTFGAADLESLTLGTNYYLGLGPTAFYVGAGLGYGSAGTTIGGSTVASVLTYSGNARVGVEFLRDRPVHLGLELRWTTVFVAYVAGNPDDWGLDVLLHF